MAQEGRSRHLTRVESMNFPVAPQSTRAVVTMVLAPYFRRIGNQIAHLDWFATSTEASVKEGDVAATSCSKKMLRLFHRLPQLVVKGVVTHRVSSLFLPALSHISPSLFQWRS